MNDDIGSLLKFDPLSAAEHITGHDYKTDEGTMALGFLAAMTHNARKEEALTSSNDTRYSINWNDALAIFADLGFRELRRFGIVLNGEPETYLIAWSDDGVLLYADSYRGMLNSGRIHYNWQANDDVEDIWNYMSSGQQQETGLIVGDHPIIEGLRYNLNRMRSNGRFLNPWKYQPFLWLNPNSEDDYKAATHRILAQLPDAVQAAVRGNA